MSAIANRYGVALFQLAKEKGTLTQIGDELNAVQKVFQDNKKLQGLLNHPKVDMEKKKEVIKESFSPLSSTVRNTLLLLLERNRIDEVLPMVDKFQALADDEQGVGRAIAYTVKPLNEEEQKRISESFAKKVGKQTLYIENRIDNSLIGGVKLRIGDKIFDGSVKGQLTRIERELTSGRR
ncbi:F0F1 ATP synthase subunit delta [Thalassorhabdus alkalitolerans]|uniref:ATP synthase subunit delta n=1 Tax=Thalassorhabdus alkalitolerans TaxID=2282697 RepID=A0ABW0YJ84_9BACI